MEPKTMCHDMTIVTANSRYIIENFDIIPNQEYIIFIIYIIDIVRIILSHYLILCNLEMTICKSWKNNNF